MKIYTRAGDLGKTRLLGGVRVAKDAPRLEACGTIDELNAVLGLVRAEPLPEDIDALLARVQNELLTMEAELATTDPLAHGIRGLGSKHVEAIEKAIDQHQAKLAPLSEFILPVGTRAGAGVHLARAVCRRAERRLVVLVRHGEHEISPDLTVYLNRLGDLLFVLARAVNAEAGQADVRWRKEP
jgi:cob(I)alamin adenosyltransferase